MVYVDLGMMDYHAALLRQQQVVEGIFRSALPETVHLLEHPHVYTLGRLGKEQNLLAPVDLQGNPIQLIRTNRGGDITYHGPGQLVGYPHLDLRTRGRDVHLYLRRLEESLILAAAHFGIKAYPRDGLTGVWTDAGKLASIGVGVRRWITMHGFALNVCTDLRYFGLMHPCGIVDCPVVSLSSLLGRHVPLEEAKPAFRRAFEKVFGSGSSARPSAAR